MKKLLLALGLVFVLGFSTVGCGKVASNTGLIKDGEIYVGTSPDYAPFEFLDKDNKITGFDIEMMNGVCKIAGLKVNYSQMGFDTIITALQATQVDVGLSGFTYDPARKVIFGTPYYESAQVALLPVGSKIKSIADLEGKNVGAGLGTTGETIARGIKDAKVTTPTNDVAFQQVQTGQLDAYICDLGVGVHYVNTGKYAMLADHLDKENMSMIFKTGNKALADKLNEALVKYMATDDYKALLKKYELS